MRNHVQGIDHVVIAVGNLDQASVNYGKLGFTLTPRGYHTMGSQNHCVMFERDYFELLSIPTPHPVTRYYQEFLRQGDGLAAIALATDDAHGCHDELAADGIAIDPPVDFSRPVELPHGTFDAAFRITQLAPEATPASRVFACQHFTRDVVWRPEYIQHRNGVVALARVVAVTHPDQVKTAAERYGAIFAVAPQAGSIGAAPRFDVATGNTPITFTTAAGLVQLLPGVAAPTRPQPCISALYFRCTSVATAREVLRANSVPFVVVSPQAVAVSPQYGNGVALVFSEE